MFGPVISEHAAASSQDLFARGLTSHTAARTQQLLTKVLQRRKSAEPLPGIDFIVDCACNYRGFDLMEFALVQLGVEKHLKHQGAQGSGIWF